LTLGSLSLPIEGLLPVRTMAGEVKMLLVGAGASGAAGMVWLWLKSRRQAAAKREDLRRGKAQLKLLPIETGAMMMSSPSSGTISTITFFNGSGEDASAWIRRRLAEVLVANPWLDGRLDTADGGETVLLYHKDTPVEGDALPAMFFRMQRPGEGGASISRGMPYENVAEALAAAGLLVKLGNDSVGRDEPLFKVALLLDAERPADRFALAVSMNHMLGDGHTFYAVHNMLSKNAPVVALNPERSIAAPLAIESAMGGNPNACMISSPPVGFILKFVTGIILSKLLGPRTTTAMYFIEDAWVAREKSSAASSSPGVEFVSTNDVVTSAFLRATRADLALMAVNFRGRVAEVDGSHAGNYENVIQYRPEDYASPALIRQSVDALHRASHPPTALPSSLGHLSCSYYGVVTNWASFAKGVEIDGCTQELHVPVFDFNDATPARIVSTCILFRPANGKVAVAVAGSCEVHARVAASGMLGAPVGLTFL